ncbi:hypothetical protein DPX16_2366 [Anabarilius grahami]|uniref:Uncharacterized protein n=1 Tax=Anabarilius grahami TaxID=495550 RepID=A0A3N0XSD9_ANAGA|nr:hypothetical protein DPX16_2366 [Anabarilius grahami]
MGCLERGITPANKSSCWSIADDKSNRPGIAVTNLESIPVHVADNTQPIRHVESPSELVSLLGHLIILIGCSATATCWFGQAFHLTQAQNGRATRPSSVGLVCQGNFGHRRC